jgi:hypothetical protein
VVYLPPISINIADVAIGNEEMIRGKILRKSFFLAAIFCDVLLISPVHSQEITVGTSQPENEVRSFPVPPNDNLNDAILIPASNFVSGTTLGATAEVGEVKLGSVFPQNTVWYKYIAKADGVVALILSGQNSINYVLDNSIDVFAGTPSVQSRLGFNSNTKGNLFGLQFSARRGVVYSIRVSAFRVNALSYFSLRVLPFGSKGGVEAFRLRSSPFSADEMFSISFPVDLNQTNIISTNFGRIRAAANRQNYSEQILVINTSSISARVDNSGNKKTYKPLFRSHVVQPRQNTVVGGVRSAIPGMLIGTLAYSDRYGSDNSIVGSRIVRATLGFFVGRTAILRRYFFTNLHYYKDQDLDINLKVNDNQYNAKLGNYAKIDLRFANDSTETARNCRVLSLGEFPYSKTIARKRNPFPQRIGFFWRQLNGVTGKPFNIMPLKTSTVELFVLPTGLGRNASRLMIWYMCDNKKETYVITGIEVNAVR